MEISDWHIDDIFVRLCSTYAHNCSIIHSTKTVVLNLFCSKAHFKCLKIQVAHH